MKHWIIYTLFLLILVTGCSFGKPEPEPELGLNLLIEPQGRVSLKREGWAEYAPVSFGAEVESYDLLRPEAGQSITILCADLTPLTVTEEGRMPPVKSKKPLLLPSQSSPCWFQNPS